MVTLHTVTHESPQEHQLDMDQKGLGLISVNSVPLPRVLLGAAYSAHKPRDINPEQNCM